MGDIRETCKKSLHSEKGEKRQAVGLPPCPPQGPDSSMWPARGCCRIDQIYQKLVFNKYSSRIYLIKINLLNISAESSLFVPNIDGGLKMRQVLF